MSTQIHLPVTPFLDFNLEPWYIQSLSPECQQKLHDNDSPSDEERTHILTHLRSAKETISRLDEHIFSLQNALHYLQEQKSQALHVHDMYQTLLSPCRRLPEDVLHEIFTQCQRIRPYSMRLPGEFSLMNGPWNLGHVCRTWRQTLTHSPTYWDSIEFGELGSSEKTINPTFMYLLEEGMRRSKSSPLDVRLLFGTRGTARRILELFSPCSMRWTALSIHLKHRSASDAVFIQNLLSPLHSQVSELQLLELQVNTVSQNFKPIVNAFQVAPKLREVRWGVPYPVSVPLYQLTVLEMRNSLSIREALSLLQAAPSLERLHLYWAPHDDELDETSLDNSLPLIHHENLSHLSLESADLLVYLTLPSLKELEISGLGEEDARKLKRLIIDSRCPLVSLDCIFDNDDHLAPSNFLDLLGAMEGLNELTFYTRDNQLLEQLFGTMTRIDSLSRSTLLPKVQSLNVFIPWPSSDPSKFMGQFETPLLYMLQSRWRQEDARVSDILSLQLRSTSTRKVPTPEKTKAALSSSDFLASFKRLKDEGMNLLIFHDSVLA